MQVLRYGLLRDTEFHMMVFRLLYQLFSVILSGMNIQQKSIDNFWSKVIQQPGCWKFNNNPNREGYHACNYRLSGETKFRKTGAHRFMMMATGHVIPPNYVVCHHCDNPGCVNPDHLFIGTVADNNRDKKIKGRTRAPCGERQGKALLTNEQARAIRAEAIVGWRVGYNNGSNIKEIAAKYGVNRELVRRIARGELYRNI